MRARRSVVAAGTAILLVSALAPGAAGQAGPVEPGTPTTWVDTEGVERGTVTVLEILDPFTGHAEDDAPAEGSRYVVVTLAFEGLDGEGIEVYPPSIWLGDSTGALWGEADAHVPDDFPQPDLSIQTVGPGSSISGYVEYVVPADAVVAQVLVQPESGTLLIPADLGSARPEVGTPVDVFGTDGATATATVTDVVDPYKAFAKDRGPAEGGRFVMATVAIQNTGQVPMRIERSGLLLRDTQGAMWGEASIETAKKPKVPVLDTVDLAPGNKVTGRRGFLVPKDASLDGLYYQGDGHLTLLASLSTPSEATPDAALDCPAVAAWWNDVDALFERLLALPYFSDDPTPMDEAATRAMLAELEAIRADHQAITPPVPLAEIHGRILGAFLLYERSAQDQLAAQGPLGGPELVAASGAAFEAAQLVGGDAVALLDDPAIAACMEG
jgi:hypothetical protein